MKRCSYPGCPVVGAFRYCERHANEVVGNLEAQMEQLRETMPSRRISVATAERIRSLMRHLDSVVSMSPMRKSPPPRTPQRAVAKHILLTLHALSGQLGVTVAALCGPCRESGLVYARHLAMAAVRELTGASLPVIGRAFGRHHTTVLHGIGRAEATEVRRLISEFHASAGCPLDSASDS